MGETLTAVDEYLDKGGPKTNFLIIWQAGEEPFD
jgi:hypothetical protein